MGNKLKKNRAISLHEDNKTAFDKSIDIAKPPSSLQRSFSFVGQRDSVLAVNSQLYGDSGYQKVPHIKKAISR